MNAPSLHQVREDLALTERQLGALAVILAAASATLADALRRAHHEGVATRRTARQRRRKAQEGRQRRRGVSAPS